MRTQDRLNAEDEERSELISVLSDEDDEEGDEEEDLLSRLGARGKAYRRIVFTVVGVVALGVCAVAFASYPVMTGAGHRRGPEALGRPPQQLHAAGPCSFAEATWCPARALLESPDVHEVATEALMRVGRRLFASEDRGMVRATVEAAFRNVTTRLEANAPQVARALDIAELTGSQQGAALSCLRLASDPQVQLVGLDVAHAMRNSDSAERGPLRRRIEAHLRPRAERLAQLRDELVPADTRDLWGEDHLWDLTLDPENVRVMQAGGRPWSLPLERHLLLPGAAADAAGRAAAASQGALEEARALLDAVIRLACLTEKDLRSSESAMSSSNAVDSAHRALFDGLNPGPPSCSEEGGQASLATAVVCSLRFGAQGVDALRAVSMIKLGIPESAFGSSGAMDVSSIGLT